MGHYEDACLLKFCGTLLAELLKQKRLRKAVEKLLGHTKCNVNSLDAHGRTPLNLAMLEPKFVLKEPGALTHQEFASPYVDSRLRSMREAKLKVVALLRKRGGASASKDPTRS